MTKIIEEKKGIKLIDNRERGNPEMKYQYFEICQLAEYPEITVKINTEMGNQYAEAEVYFDGIRVDTFDIQEIIKNLVEEHILTVKEVQRKEKQRRIKRIKENKCPFCFKELTKDKGTHYCKTCDNHYNNEGVILPEIKITSEVVKNGKRS
jgi:hypothetical protein